jgi:toxin YoeB
MERKKVVWTRKAEIQLFSVMDYYAERNQSDCYSLKLELEINDALENLDFSVSLPKKVFNQPLYYIVYNHIRAFFEIETNTIIVILIWDERRNPANLEFLLSQV